MVAGKGSCPPRRDGHRRGTVLMNTRRPARWRAGGLLRPALMQTSGPPPRTTGSRVAQCLVI